MQKYTFFVNSKTFYTFSESNKQYNSSYSMTVLYKIIHSTRVVHNICTSYIITCL